MTKMTVLHFASPFAFSMPSAADVARGTTGASDASTAALAASGNDDPASSLFTGDGASPLPEDAVPSTESAGFETSFHDIVLRRYREQQGSQIDAAATSFAMPSQGEDEVSG